jgi:hypothetical protein
MIIRGPAESDSSTSWALCTLGRRALLDAAVSFCLLRKLQVEAPRLLALDGPQRPVGNGLFCRAIIGHMHGESARCSLAMTNIVALKAAKSGHPTTR